MERLDPFIQAENDNRSAQVIQIDAGKSLATVALCFAVAAFAFSAAVFVLGRQSMEDKAQAASAAAVVRSQQAYQESRLAQDRVDQITVQLAKKGINVEVH